VQKGISVWQMFRICGKSTVSPESIIYMHCNLIDLEKAQIMSPRQTTVNTVIMYAIKWQKEAVANFSYIMRYAQV
jgi:glutamyl/glutaminyl-tRNA synthetase